MRVRQSVGRQHQGKASQKVAQRSKPLRLIAVLVYVIVYLVLFAPRSENHDILIYILIVTTIALWFGPISLLGSGNNRKVYDPATLFNFAVFYYVIKGIPFAWNEKPAFLSFMAFEDIVHVFPQVILYMALGLLAWNWAYERAMRRQSPRPESGTGTAESSPIKSRRYTYLGVVLLGLVGTFSLYMLFDSIGGDVTLFIRQPWLLAYLGTSTFGVRSSLAFVWVYGTYMLPLASLVWLAITSSRGGTPGLAWWVFAMGSVAALLLFSPRAIVVGFVFSGLVVYHLTVSVIRPFFLLVLGLSVIVFSYLINVWRGIAGTLSLHGVSEGVGILTERANIDEALRFLGSTDLSDIRMFVLISHTYGNALPLKFGSTLLRIVYQVIPRAIWPDKPLGLGNEIGLLFGASYSGAPPGFFGEMYMNFHVFGVIAGALVLGYGLGVLYREWVVRRRGLVGVVLYAILVPRILLLPSSTIANIVITTIILVVATIVAFGISIAHRGKIGEVRLMSLHRHRD